jgi:hypothetical protein
MRWHVRSGHISDMSTDTVHVCFIGVDRKSSVHGGRQAFR